MRWRCFFFIEIVARIYADLLPIHSLHTSHHNNYIKKGSITGAFSAITKTVSPSFVLLAVKDNSVVCYVYKYTAEGEVDVSKTEFTKKEKEAVVQSTASKNMLNNLLS